MSINLSLDRLKQLFPHLRFNRPTIHIAGTNGKGSVSAILTSMLIASSPPLRIGRFNSPHLVSILDSINVNGADISQTVYKRVKQEIQNLDRMHGTKLTEFEMLTMTALRIFETENVDLVILEVGMGGRLDATNIVPSSCILVSALTAVDLDHQAFLGNTVSLIAREKAGIAREGKPFVLGKQTHAEVQEVVRKVVEKAGGTLIPAPRVSVLDQDIPGWSLLDRTSTPIPFAKLVRFHSKFFDTDVHAHFPLHGDHQLDNLGTALGVMDALLSASEMPSLHLQSHITPQTLVNGIETVMWRGRLSFHAIPIRSQPSPTSTSSEVSNLLVLADGAHNPASAETLGAYITSLLNGTQISSPNPSRRTQTHIPITFVLSLSYSPPKTPLQTLSPILSPVIQHSNDTTISIFLNIALLPFSPPDGMPWVKPVPLHLMREAVRAILPDLPEDALWVAPCFDDADGTDVVNCEHGSSSLYEAFRWAAGKHGSNADIMDINSNGSTCCPGIVVLAGSLYLVADFYRLLEQQA